LLAISNLKLEFMGTNPGFTSYSLINLCLSFLTKK
jgi:hypothetical protein